VIRRHVSAEVIARFSEGDLSGRKAARVRSHLAHCPRCASLRDDLARVPALLASADVPPMPEHLAARISSALSTESARRAAGTGPVLEPHPARADGVGADGVSTDGVPAARRGRAAAGRQGGGWSWPRIPNLSARATGWVAAAAAAVVIAGGGTYLVIQQGSSGGSGVANGTSAAAPTPASTRSASGTGAPAARLSRPLPYQRGDNLANFTPVTTGTDYVPAKLESQVRATLTDFGPLASAASPALTHGTAGTANPGTSGQAGGAARIGSFTPAALEGCVSRISGGDQVLLVDVARYQSAPAAVIVTAPPGKGPEQVWVVGPGCSASRSDVLHRTVLPARR